MTAQDGNKDDIAALQVANADRALAEASQELSQAEFEKACI